MKWSLLSHPDRYKYRRDKEMNHILQETNMNGDVDVLAHAHQIYSSHFFFYLDWNGSEIVNAVSWCQNEKCECGYCKDPFKNRV